MKMVAILIFIVLFVIIYTSTNGSINWAILPDFFENGFAELNCYLASEINID